MNALHEDSAFPQPVGLGEAGLSAVDYFAAQFAAEGYNQYGDFDVIAREAYDLAEAMMRERAKRRSNDLR